MNLNDKIISRGFVMAGLMNLTVLVFSRFFTNPTIPKFDPEVMSNFGLLMIVLWGIAYISIRKTYYNVKWLVGLFAIEKLVYGYVWLSWMMNNNLSEVYEEDAMAGIFYAIYGVNDWLFCIFFLFVFIKLVKAKRSQ